MFKFFFHLCICLAKFFYFIHLSSQFFLLVQYFFRTDHFKKKMSMTILNEGYKYECTGGGSDTCGSNSWVCVSRDK